MTTIAMVPGEVYQDFQGTVYIVEKNTGQYGQIAGRLAVTVIFRKKRIMICDDSRMTDGSWEFLTVFGQWIRMSWSPMKYTLL